MTPIPPPPPEERQYLRPVTCPNCGAPNHPDSMRCFNCGRTLKPSKSSGVQTLFIILFVLIGLPSLCLSGCFLIIGLGSLGRPGQLVGGWNVVVIGLALAALFGLLLYLAFI